MCWLPAYDGSYQQKPHPSEPNLYAKVPVSSLLLWKLSFFSCLQEYKQSSLKWVPFLVSKFCIDQDSQPFCQGFHPCHANHKQKRTSCCGHRYVFKSLNGCTATGNLECTRGSVPSRPIWPSSDLESICALCTEYGSKMTIAFVSLPSSFKLREKSNKLKKSSGAERRGRETKCKRYLQWSWQGICCCIQFNALEWIPLYSGAAHTWC